MDSLEQRRKKATNAAQIIRDIDRRMDEMRTRRAVLVQELMSTCPHDNVNVTRTFSPGGYDYVSSVTVTHKCLLCEKILKQFDDPRHIGRHG